MKLHEYWVVLDWLPTYAISNYGRVVNDKTGHECRTELDRHGYVRVILYRKGKRKRAYLHKLVARAFFLNYRSNINPRHINGNKQDNTVLNLTLLGEN
jgi:hypothetical protein